MVSKIGHAVSDLISEQLNELDNAPKTDKNQQKLNFLFRGLYMMSFYALKICESQFQKLLSLCKALKPGSKKDTFILTLLQLTMKENEVNKGIG